MIPKTQFTYIYARVYINKLHTKRIIYSGITDDMYRRQKEHEDGKSITTNRYNKSYLLSEIRYKEYEIPRHVIEDLEKRFKRLKLNDKMDEITNWEVFSG